MIRCGWNFCTPPVVELLLYCCSVCALFLGTKNSFQLSIALQLASSFKNVSAEACFILTNIQNPLQQTLYLFVRCRNVIGMTRANMHVNETSFQCLGRNHSTAMRNHAELPKNSNLPFSDWYGRMAVFENSHLSNPWWFCDRGILARKKNNKQD